MNNHVKNIVVRKMAIVKIMNLIVKNEINWRAVASLGSSVDELQGTRKIYCKRYKKKCVE